MSHGATGPLTGLDRWSPLALVAGGVLSIWFLQVALFGIPGFTIVAALGGLLVALGVGGLGARLRTQGPTLALLGEIAALVAGIAFATHIVVALGAVVLGTPAAPIEAAGGPDPLSVAYWAIGVGLVVGGGGLWTGESGRSTAVLLITASLTVPAVNVAKHLGVTFPDWHSPANFVAFAVAVLGAGVLLDADRIVADGWQPSPSAADDVTDDGTADRDSSDLDLDGSESRTIPMRMATRVHLSRLLYELIPGPLWFGVGAEYPLVRRLGRILRLGAGTEQWIAENEFLRQTITADERDGIGSPHWRLGVTLFAGVGLLVFMAPWLLLLTGGSPGGVLAAALVFGGGIGTIASVARTIRRLDDRQ